MYVWTYAQICVHDYDHVYLCVMMMTMIMMMMLRRLMVTITRSVLVQG